MGETDLILRSDEASKGSFQSIKKLEGNLMSVKRVPNEFDETRDSAKVELEDVIILEMIEGESEPDLEDDKFRFFMNYAKKEKAKAHQNTFYAAAFLKSAEELAKARGVDNGGVADLIGSRVVLELKEVLLFTRTNKETQEKEEITGTNFVFASDEAGEQAPIEEHIKSILIGKNKPNALRKLMEDSRAKREPAWRQKLNAGTIAEELGLEVVDGIFTEPQS